MTQSADYADFKDYDEARIGVCFPWCSLYLGNLRNLWIVPFSVSATLFHFRNRL